MINWCRQVGGSLKTGFPTVHRQFVLLARKAQGLCQPELKSSITRHLAVELFTGTPTSLDLTNDLLDLVCLYGDRDPLQEDSPEQRTDAVVMNNQ